MPPISIGVAIDHDMFRAEDGKALHDAGVAVRVHLERPDRYERYAKGGVDLLADVRAAMAEGVIDTISGDDVAFLRKLRDYNGKERLPRRLLFFKDVGVSGMSVLACRLSAWPIFRVWLLRLMAGCARSDAASPMP